MKSYIHILLVAFSLGFVTHAYAQHKRYAIRNGIGIQGGITQFDILTDNFETKSSTGYIGGLASWVDIPHKWYNVSYNILLSENNLDISGRAAPTAQNEFLEYKMLTVQASLLLHIKLIKNNLTLDVGPMLQYNGELELKDEANENYILTGFNALRAEDIADISQFNVNAAVGLSAGFGQFSLRGQYIYGFTNILGRLNDQNLNLEPDLDELKGSQSMLTLTAALIF